MFITVCPSYDICHYCYCIVVYNLQPENLLLDSAGYVKLVSDHVTY